MVGVSGHNGSVARVRRRVCQVSTVKMLKTKFVRFTIGLALNILKLMPNSILAFYIEALLSLQKKRIVTSISVGQFRNGMIYAQPITPEV